jgi:hypothetical protein
MDILELPRVAREARFELYWQMHLETALDGGVRQDRAHETANRMDELIRAMVRAIQQGGGASGGRA